MSTSQQFANELSICPNTWHQVTREQITIQHTDMGVSTLWRCSACGRWHMLEEESCIVRKKDDPNTSLYSRKDKIIH